MQHLEEVCDVTLISEDNERIRAHKVVLACVSTPSGSEFSSRHIAIYEINGCKKTKVFSWRYGNS